MTFIVKRLRGKRLPALDLECGEEGILGNVRNANNVDLHDIFHDNDTKKRESRVRKQGKPHISTSAGAHSEDRGRRIRREFQDYGYNPFGIRTYLTAEEVRRGLALEYKLALDKVEHLGWKNTAFDGGYTLLHWSARCGDVELCRFLIAKYGADPRKRDDRGMLPKDHARKKGHKQVEWFFERVCGI